MPPSNSSVLEAQSRSNVSEFADNTSLHSYKSLDVESSTEIKRDTRSDVPTGTSTVELASPEKSLSGYSEDSDEENWGTLDDIERDANPAYEIFIPELVDQREPSPIRHSVEYSSVQRDTRTPERVFHSGALTGETEDEQMCDSLKFLLSTLELRRHRLGETHPAVGEAWNEIGNFYFRARKCDKALKAYDQALQCDESIQLAAAYSNIGTLYWSAGDIPKSIKFLRNALHMYTCAEGEKGRDAGSALNVSNVLYQLGLAMSLQKDYVQSLLYLGKALKIRESMMGHCDVVVARTLDAVGKVHFLQGALKAAMEKHEEAFRIKIDSNSDERALIPTLLNIANVHRARQRWEDALRAYERVLQLQLAVLAEYQVDPERQHLTLREATDVVETLEVIGDIHKLRRSDSDADQSYEEAIALCEAVGIDEEDPRVLTLRMKLFE
jgi:tetratricopeptide (TPR) repeat protein